LDFRTDRGGIRLRNGQAIGDPGVFTYVSLQHDDTRQLGLPSRDGQGIGLVRRTGVLASGKYYGRHLKKFKLRYLRGGSSDSNLLRVWF